MNFLYNWGLNFLADYYISNGQNIYLMGRSLDISEHWSLGKLIIIYYLKWDLAVVVIIVIVITIILRRQWKRCY